jgi:hypothetical protein
VLVGVVGQIFNETQLTQIAKASFLPSLGMLWKSGEGMGFTFKVKNHQMLALNSESYLIRTCQWYHVPPAVIL